MPTEFPWEERGWDTFLSSIRELVIHRNKSLPYVFISYAWEDDAAANIKLQKRLLTLKQDLERAGMSVFLDVSSLQGDLKEAMQTEIKKADFILLICTPRYCQRVQLDPAACNVAFEYQEALRKCTADGRNIIPLRFQDDFAASVPSRLGKILVRDFSREDKLGYSYAMTALSNPIGLLAAIYDFRQGDSDYISLLNKYHYTRLHNLPAFIHHVIERRAAIIALEENKECYPIQCLSGAIGVGKTTLACIYAQQLLEKDSNYIVHRMTLGSDREFDHAFRQCAEIFGELGEGVSTTDIVKIVFQHLSGMSKVLLILDNVTSSSQKKLQIFFEESIKHTGLQILLTSCNQLGWPPLVKSHVVEVFTETEALDYLRGAHLDSFNEETARELIVALAYHPAALMHVIYYLRENIHLTLANFYKRYQEYGVTLLSVSSSNQFLVDSPLCSIRRMFSVHLEDLEAIVSSVAIFSRKLLGCLVYLSGITEHQLVDLMDYDSLEMDNALKLLRRYSLIAVNPTNLTICCSSHKLLEAVLDEKYPEAQQACFIQVAKQLALKVRSFGENDIESRERMREWILHCDVVLSHTFFIKNAPLASRQDLFTIANRVERYYVCLGNFAAAEALMPITLELAETHPDRIKLAATLGNRGSLFYKLKRLPEAQHAFEQALNVYRMVSEEKSMLAIKPIISILMQLVKAYKDNNQLNMAQQGLQELLRMYQTIYPGQAHPNIALVFYQLARLQEAQLQYIEAKQYFEQALLIYQKIYANQIHADTMVVLQRLGGACQKVGLFKEAKQYLQNAADMSKAIYGEEHSTTKALIEDCAKMQLS